MMLANRVDFVSLNLRGFLINKKGNDMFHFSLSLFLVFFFESGSYSPAKLEFTILLCVMCFMNV
jgi:hypothetical protein